MAGVTVWYDSKEGTWFGKTADDLATLAAKFTANDKSGTAVVLSPLTVYKWNGTDLTPGVA